MMDGVRRTDADVCNLSLEILGSKWQQSPISRLFMYLFLCMCNFPAQYCTYSFILYTGGVWRSASDL